MANGNHTRLLVVWLALSAITLAQLGIGSADAKAGHAASFALGASAVGIALLKVGVILREFMEVRHAPALLGRLTDLWVVFTGVALLGGYFAGLAWSS